MTSYFLVTSIIFAILWFIEHISRCENVNNPNIPSNMKGRNTEQVAVLSIVFILMVFGSVYALIEFITWMMP